MYIGFDNGYFKVIELVGKNKNRSLMWRCECRCGKSNTILSSSCLKRIDTKSCGCARKGINKNITHTFKHGLSFHPLYKVLKGMKERCKGGKDSKFYKDKGIKVYKLWLDNPKEFIEWANSKGYRKGLSIDRIDNSKDYFPDNCRFITRSENSKRTPIENRRGEKSHLSKLTEKEVIEIKIRLKNNEVGIHLAREFNITKGVIYGIKHNKIWKHIGAKDE